MHQVAVLFLQVGWAEHRPAHYRGFKVRDVLAELRHDPVGICLGELGCPCAVADVQFTGGVAGRPVGGLEQLDSQHRAAIGCPGRI